MTREEHIAALEKYRDGILSGGISVPYDDLMIALDASITALRGTKPDSVTITLPNNGMCAIVRKVNGHYEIDTGRVEKWLEDEK